MSIPFTSFLFLLGICRVGIDVTSLSLSFSFFVGWLPIHIESLLFLFGCWVGTEQSDICFCCFFLCQEGSLAKSIGCSHTSSTSGLKLFLGFIIVRENSSSLSSGTFSTSTSIPVPVTPTASTDLFSAATGGIAPKALQLLQPNIYSVSSLKSDDSYGPNTVGICRLSSTNSSWHGISYLLNRGDGIILLHESM